MFSSKTSLVMVFGFCVLSQTGWFCEEWIANNLMLGLNVELTIKERDSDSSNG